MNKVQELIGEGADVVIVGAGPGDETFTHSVFGTFNIRRIIRHLSDRKIVRVTMNYQDMTRDRDIDAERVAELLSDPSACSTPIVLVDCEDGTHVMIDGLHRVAARHARGDDWVPARIITLTEAKPFMVEMRVTRADGSIVDQRELDKAFIDSDWGRHNAPDGRPRPGSTGNIAFPPRNQP